MREPQARKKPDPIPDTTAIENVVDMTRFVPDYMDFCRSFGHPRDLVTIHKAKLGKQTTTFQGSAHRLWVWVRPTWTVFVGNAKGICFEVPEGTSPEKAWESWAAYKSAMA